MFVKPLLLLIISQTSFFFFVIKLHFLTYFWFSNVVFFYGSCFWTEKKGCKTSFATNINTQQHIVTSSNIELQLWAVIWISKKYVIFVNVHILQKKQLRSIVLCDAHREHIKNVLAKQKFLKQLKLKTKNAHTILL